MDSGLSSDPSVPSDETGISCREGHRTLDLHTNFPVHIEPIIHSVMTFFLDFLGRKYSTV